jgi:hypothetical protein
MSQRDNRKSCHSDQYLAEFHQSSGTDYGTDTSPYPVRINKFSGSISGANFGLHDHPHQLRQHRQFKIRLIFGAACLTL